MHHIFLRGSLELMFSIVIISLLIFVHGKSLKDKPKLYYAFAWILSIASMVMAALVFTEVITVEYNVLWVRAITSITSGYLPACVFMYVMYAGALSNQNPIKQKLMRIRTELSIIGTILYLPHTILYSVLSAPRGVAALLSGEINIYFQIITWTGIILAILLIVLGVTSIKRVKLKIGTKKWLKLHKMAYLFYFMCFSHWATMAFRREHYGRFAFYVVVFGSYFIAKLRINASKKRAKQIANQTQHGLA